MSPAVEDSTALQMRQKPQVRSFIQKSVHTGRQQATKSNGEGKGPKQTGGQTHNRNPLEHGFPNGGS